MIFLKNFRRYLQACIVDSVNGYNKSLQLRSVNDIRFYLKYDELTKKALLESTPGISKDKLGRSEFIVSLTTHDKRIYDVHAAIESIMQGSLKPNRIVLWISEEYRNVTLPLTLQKQMERGLEIIYCKDIRSYTKLVPALKKFPEASIITIDDDIIYPHDTLENLINAYLKHPHCICANWIREYPTDLERNYISILKWPILFDAEQVSDRYFFEGFAGVLYPAHSMDGEVFKEDIFLDICKYADDVWFNAMALKAGTKVKYAWKHYSLDSFIYNNNCQSVALLNINSKGKLLNDTQIKAVYGKYGLWKMFESDNLLRK